MAALIADLSRKVSTVPFLIAARTCDSEAITSLLVESSATLSMLLAPPINAPATTRIAIIITAVRYFTTLVATAVPMHWQHR